MIRFSCQPRGLLRASKKKEPLLTKEGARFVSIKPNSLKSTHTARGVPNTIGTLFNKANCVDFLEQIRSPTVYRKLRNRWQLLFRCAILKLILYARRRRRQVNSRPPKPISTAAVGSGTVDTEANGVNSTMSPFVALLVPPLCRSSPTKI